jgi:hypothetical protein
VRQVVESQGLVAVGKNQGSITVGRFRNSSLSSPEIFENALPIETNTLFYLILANYQADGNGIGLYLNNMCTNSHAMRRAPPFADDAGASTSTGRTLFGLDGMDARHILDENPAMRSDNDEVRYIHIPQYYCYHTILG